MLMLGRKQGQKIKILLENNQEITILIAKVTGKTVKIGFEAPQSVKVLREEVALREV